MIISIIAAIGNNNVIGINNALPWDLPADLAHFRKLTAGKPVVMGQRTFESIGKPLPERINIILSRDEKFCPEGCIVVQSVDQALNSARKAGVKEVMICGGVSVYNQFLPLADRMYLTLIKGDFQGDSYFPSFDYNDWNEIERTEHEPDKDNPYKYAFVVLEKKSSN